MAGKLQGVGSGGSLGSRFGEFGDLLKQPLRDPMREFLKQPFRKKDWHTGPKPMPRYQVPLRTPIKPQFGKRIPLPRPSPIPGPGLGFLKGFGMLGMAYTAYEVYQIIQPGHGYTQYPGHYDLSGFGTICNVGYPPGEEPTYIKYASLGPGPSVPCSQTAVDVPTQAYGSAIAIGLSIGWFCIGQNNDIGIVPRMGRNEQYGRSNNKTDPIPWIPLQEEYGPLPMQKPDPDLQPAPTPKTDNRPFAPPPYKGPPTFFGPPHEQRPPGKNEHERKERMPYSAWQRITRALASGMSELDDFVDAMFDALPRWAQFNQGVKPGSRYFNKIEGKMHAIDAFLRANPDDTQYLKDAAWNFVDNEIEDRIFGAIGKKGRDIVHKNPYWKSPMGLQAGGRYRPYYYGG